jgi:hypothetical protein
VLDRQNDIKVIYIQNKKRAMALVINDKVMWRARSIFLFDRRSYGLENVKKIV